MDQGRCPGPNTTPRGLHEAYVQTGKMCSYGLSIRYSSNARGVGWNIQRSSQYVVQTGRLCRGPVVRRPALLRAGLAHRDFGH